MITAETIKKMVDTLHREPKGYILLCNPSDKDEVKKSAEGFRIKVRSHPIVPKDTLYLIEEEYIEKYWEGSEEE